MAFAHYWQAEVFLQYLPNYQWLDIILSHSSEVGEHRGTFEVVLLI